MYATHASVVIVNPAGTLSGPRIRVISATFAPLPPNRSRISREPSAKSYTDRVPVVIGAPTLPVSGRAQADMRVVLGRLGDRALGLAQRARLGGGRLGQRAGQGLGQEDVGRLVEPERAGLAPAAHDAAGGAAEADEVLALAARGAGRQLRREAGGDQELEPEGELVGHGRLAVGVGVQQGQLVAEQVEDSRVRVRGLEQARDGVAGARGAVE